METTMVGKIMEAFADDLFRYLLPRRINVMDCRVREKWDKLPRVFHPHFGMSVLCESFRRQKLFFTYYAMMFPSYVQSVEAYITFCATYADTLSEQQQNDVYKSMRVVASMILELGVFCHLKGYKNFKYYSTICFGEFFKIFMKQVCPMGYNWLQLKELSADDAKAYADGKYEVLLDQNRVEFRNEWLRSYDTWAAVYPAVYIIPQTFDSNEVPAYESDQTSEQETTNAEEIFQEAAFAKAADMSELQKKADEEKKVLIVNTSNEIAEKYKSSPKKLKIENEYVPGVPVIDEDLLEKFKLRVNAEQDSASQELGELLRSNAKTNILMNDETFLQVITQKTSRRSRKKMKMGDILELAQLVLGGNDHLARVLVRTVHHIGRVKKAKQAAKKDEPVEGNKAPSVTKPWKETGAIPKAKKDSTKGDDRPPHKIHNKLMHDFKITVSSENDDAGVKLAEFFKFPVSADILLSDEVFREVMQLTVNYPTNRWRNDWLLSIAKSLIANDLTAGQQPTPVSNCSVSDEFLSKLLSIVITEAADKGKSPPKTKNSGNTDKVSLPVKFDLL